MYLALSFVNGPMWLEFSSLGADIQCLNKRVVRTKLKNLFPTKALSVHGILTAHFNLVATPLDGKRTACFVSEIGAPNPAILFGVKVPPCRRVISKALATGICHAISLDKRRPARCDIPDFFPPAP
jgi:hypothetical protein